MSLKRDFISRIIEESATILARMLKLKNDGKFEEAHEEFKIACRQYTGKNEQELDTLFDEDLQPLTGELQVPQWQVLADLLKIEAETLVAQNNPGAARQRFRQTLSILRFLQENALREKRYDLSLIAKIHEIEKVLSENF